MDYQPPEPRVADQELYDNIYLPTKSMRAFDNLRDPIVKTAARITIKNKKTGRDVNLLIFSFNNFLEYPFSFKLG